jgi:hypothetical protein
MVSLLLLRGALSGCAAVPSPVPLPFPLRPLRGTLSRLRERGTRRRSVFLRWAGESAPGGFSPPPLGGGGERGGEAFFYAGRARVRPVGFPSPACGGGCPDGAGEGAAVPFAREPPLSCSFGVRSPVSLPFPLRFRCRSLSGPFGAPSPACGRGERGGAFFLRWAGESAPGGFSPPPLGGGGCPARGGRGNGGSVRAGAASFLLLRGALSDSAAAPSPAPSGHPLPLAGEGNKAERSFALGGRACARWGFPSPAWRGRVPRKGRERERQRGSTGARTGSESSFKQEIH